MRSLIRSYYGFQFFFPLLVWLPVFYEYQLRIGLSEGQIFEIQSLYYLAFCFLEVPTGLLADRYGYKRCVVFGAATLVLGNLLPVLAPSYAGMLAHFMSIALARSLVSGASSAYLYDYLTEQGRAADYKDIEGKSRAYGLVGKIACWAAVGSLMKWDMTSPYWLTALASVAALGFAALLPRLERRHAPHAAVTGFAGALRLVWSKPLLMIVMVQGVGVFVLGRIVQVNLFQPILADRGFDLAWFGWMMSFMTAFEAIGSSFSAWLRRYMGDLNAVFALTFVMAASLMAVPFSSQAGTAVALGVFSLATGFSFPIQKQLINDVIPDGKYRATILSLESIIDRAVNAWVASLLAAVMTGGGLHSFLYYSGLVTFGGVALLLGLFLVAQNGHRAAGKVEP